eukprot:1952946-Pyramimonas_sp.AAC.1
MTPSLAGIALQPLAFPPQKTSSTASETSVGATPLLVGGLGAVPGPVAWLSAPRAVGRWRRRGSRPCSCPGSSHRVWPVWSCPRIGNGW